MDYERESIEEYRDDPLGVVRWMSSEGFLKIDNVPCRQCGQMLDLRGTSLLFEWIVSSFICKYPLLPVTLSPTTKARRMSLEVPR